VKISSKPKLLFIASSEEQDKEKSELVNKEDFNTSSLNVQELLHIWKNFKYELKNSLNTLKKFNSVEYFSKYKLQTVIILKVDKEAAKPL